MQLYHTLKINLLSSQNVTFSLFHINYSLDVLLMKIRSKTISYATMKKRANEEREKELENSIQCLESKISLTEDEKTKLENNRQALVTLREKKMEGVLLRSTARWIAEGEKITSFYGLEKRNYVSKQMITHQTLLNTSIF